MYGITKYAGELLARYYVYKYDLDIRGVRWPGIISSEALPGGGTTDYAVEMFYYAVEGKPYTCYLREDTELPMMYMPDAIKSIVDLMKADKSKLKLFVGYNVTAFSFTPKQLADEIRKYIPDFKVEYKPDFRQKIADSWPRSLDDSVAREEWGWKPDWTFEAMVKDMLIKIAGKLGKNLKLKNRLYYFHVYFPCFSAEFIQLNSSALIIQFLLIWPIFSSPLKPGSRSFTSSIIELLISPSSPTPNNTPLPRSQLTR